jgi:hypothetical protein
MFPAGAGKNAKKDPHRLARLASAPAMRPESSRTELGGLVRVVLPLNRGDKICFFQKFRLLAENAGSLFLWKKHNAP